MTLENWPRTPALIAKAARLEGRRHRVVEIVFADGWLACTCGSELHTPSGPEALRDVFSAHRRAHGCAATSTGHSYRVEP